MAFWDKEYKGVSVKRAGLAAATTGASEWGFGGQLWNGAVNKATGAGDMWSGVMGGGEGNYVANPSNFQLYGDPAGAQQQHARASSMAEGARQQGGRQQQIAEGERQLGLQAMGTGEQVRQQGLAFQDRQTPQFGDTSQGRLQAQGGINALNQFAQQGEGPSAAEAMMRNQSGANMRQSLALARSGRGAGNAQAMRAAIGQNAVTQGQTTNNIAALRANEQQQWRQQQLGALQGAGQLGSSLYGQDVNRAAQQGQLQLAGMQQNDAMTLGLGQQGLGYQNVALGRAGAAQNAEQLGLGYADQGLGYEQLGQDYAQMDMTGRMGIEQVQSGVSLGQEQMATQERGARLGAAATVAAAAASDRRAKSHVEELGDIREALSGKPSKSAGKVARSAKGYKYQYKRGFKKRPGFGSGTFHGPMAQDLEKTPLGSSLVRKASDGTRMVDGVRSGLVALSAAGQALKEIDEIREALHGG